MERDLSALKIDPDARGNGGPNLKIIIPAVLIAIAAVVFASWYFTARKPVEVRVTTARRMDAGGAAVLNASGYVTPRRRATVSAKITGKVTEVLIEEGMAVEESQVIARLDDADARASLRAVEAEHGVAEAALAELTVELANARRRLERSRELRARDLSSQEELDDAETAVASLEARIEVAKEQVKAAERNIAVARQVVENCTVRAPFAGIVVSKDAQPGEMISPISAGGGYTRTGIATIVDMESLEIEVDVNESYIARVAAGQPVEAVLDAYPDWEIPARVLTVIPTADRQKATVRVRIAFDGLDPRILPDMGVKVAFLEEDRTAATGPVVVVPRAAVAKLDDRDVVFVVGDGRVERRAVSLGGARGDGVEVIAGLRGGEQVVTEGVRDLRDGQRVAVKR